MSSNSKPRVLFLNRSYWPDMEATGQLLTALCEGLASDFDVHVLAGQPNATAGEEDFATTASRNGVTIHRVKHTTWPKRNMALKAVNFLSFVWACRRQIHKLPQPDIVVFETDPFLLPFVASGLSRKSGCRMVGYLQDIYPDVAVALGKVSNSWAIRKLRNSLFSIYRRCDRMVVLSRDMKQLLLDGGVEEQHIRIVPNWADTESIQPVDEANRFTEKFQLQGKFVAMYSGNLGLTQRLEQFVEAASLLRDEPDIEFVFVGRGARRPELERQVTELQLNNVMFCDYQPLEELSHSLSAADLHLIPLTESLSRCLMPSKLYGILAAGRPYLTNAPEDSELYHVTTQQEVGFTVKAGSAEAIAARIREARSDQQRLTRMGQAARRLALDQYTPAHSIDAFSRTLTEVA
ncbi:MAG: glycosyltransferase family 4 protein [Planctomycetaceae bacterium]|nr:glycosyltransferase family 4 protein [Planctomycetaceae bacterium]